MLVSYLTMKCMVEKMEEIGFSERAGRFRKRWLEPHKGNADVPMKDTRELLLFMLAAQDVHERDSTFAAARTPASSVQPQDPAARAAPTPGLPSSATELEPARVIEGDEETDGDDEGHQEQTSAIEGPMADVQAYLSWKESPLSQGSYEVGPKEFLTIMAEARKSFQKK